VVHPLRLRLYRPTQPNLIDNSPRPADWPQNIGNGLSVVILAAGIAGLVSAYELIKLGFQCTLLEATDRVGGGVRTIRSADLVEEVESSQTCVFDSDDELYFNAGAARTPHYHELILGYCREFAILAFHIKVALGLGLRVKLILEAVSAE
jgi:monoamine oxidase